MIRFCAIDPMHNLFHGTAKHVFKLWIAEGHLNQKQLQQIEERIEAMEATSFPGSFFGEGKTLVGAGHVAPRFWVLN